MKIDIGSTDEIDKYELIADTFFKNVFEWAGRGYLITDESQLSDFTYSGKGWRVIAEDGGDDPHHWDDWVKGVIKREYGIELVSTSIRLVDLFKMISEKGK
jgi:hypothetical protein